MTGPITLTYKRVDSLAIQLDVYPPSCVDSAIDTIPAVVYFHGGGLTVGNRESWFPHWLKDRVVASGLAFISADYRLLPPSTGHQVLEDIQDLFLFLRDGLNPALRAASPSSSIQVDSYRVAVVGTSAGGLCAYLAAIHATPKPKALVSFYGMGGDFITPHYLHEKKEVFFRGRELIDPKTMSQFLFPLSDNLDVTSESPLAYHPLDSSTPGHPSNPRMQLARLYLQMGNFLDYLTGQHEPSLSSILRNLLNKDSDGNPHEYQHNIPERHRILFPQYSCFADWPPVLLVHGSNDSAVHLHESIHLHGLLQHAGVVSTLKIIDGEEHSFDYAPDAAIRFGTDGALFDQVCLFITQNI